MNLTELISAVYTQTNRPDLVAETLQAVLESTISIHSIDTFEKDLREADVVFSDGSLYIQQLDISMIPFYRKVAYLRKMDSGVNSVEQFRASGSVGNFLQKVEMSSIIDSYGYEKGDIFYQAGSSLNIKSTTPLKYVKLGWYAHPTVSSDPAIYSSWIAQELPYVIIYRAAGQVYATIGEDKSYAIFMRSPVPRAGEESGGLYYQQLATLRRDNIHWPT